MRSVVGLSLALGMAAASGAAAQGFAVLTTFGPNHGGNPYAPVAVGSAFYGATFQGGTYGLGTVYRVIPKTGALKVLYNFAGGNDAAHPDGSLLYYNGMLYGATAQGGTAGCANGGCGTIYSVNPATGAENVLYSFRGGTDGTGPIGALVTEGGLLYGATGGGGGGTCVGNFGCGTVFSVDPVSGTETVLHRFAGGSSDGSDPYAGPIADGATLYGTTRSGGSAALGTVYALDLTSGTETVLHNFAGEPDGTYPESTLVAVNGLLYGTTNAGGVGPRGGHGTIFSLDPASLTEQVVLAFRGGAKGSQPGEIIAAGRDFYGVTDYGGAGVGLIYKAVQTNGHETVLYQFTGGADGAFPVGKLLQKSGSFYGVAANGGSANLGTLYKLTP